MTKKIIKILLDLAKILSKVFILLLILFLAHKLWVRFSTDDHTLPYRMIDQCNKNFENCIIRMDSVTDFEWDEVFIIDEGTPNQFVENILGSKYDYPEYQFSRKIIFRLNGTIVYQDNNRTNPWKLAPSGSVFFRYEQETAPYFISLNKENALFRVKFSDKVDGKEYYILEVYKGGESENH